MFYRETGQFKSHYAEDSAIFPIQQDRIALYLLLAVAFIGVPLFATDYWMGSILTPFLILSLAAIWLNILTGYAGQLSLGSAAFMAVGAFTAYNFALRMPYLPLIVDFILAGLVAALVGVLFGLPSLRIKGFYLAVATLAAQFFIIWLLNRVSWFSNNDASGVINAPEIIMFGHTFGSVTERYLLTLLIVALLALLAKNMVRCHIGRAWMAIRDMDVAAEVIGIKMLKTKLLAFAVSSFYCGVAGALWAFLYLRTLDAQADAFSLAGSFQILFMIIIGGVGSILGSFLGAAFIVLLPIFLNIIASLFGSTLNADVVAHLEVMIFGILIIFFLIVEPHGLARLWVITKEKLRLWPFPH
ncbi:ABC-type branched-chain amino acid transport system, permease component [Beggiatoa alba B18LD]|uniref:ABC-type branched-chain amino acid transport system, permease component n=1 Tax=Beggiatoa alba B18LD TaxID=395493 RepID=I3CDX1_9GAMM|nr:branched-chain amino acid ABC transporter permease [Beggiatoa alba]EIJ41814.1 ABC-type branched-chain amino acid transport system, permease component [Beggiatoa alba B18LD]